MFRTDGIVTPWGTLSRMSRGIGKTQQAILDALAAQRSDDSYAALDASVLAERISKSPRQTRQAAHSLAGRGLVALSKEPGGRAGVGKYGPLTPRLGRDRRWGGDDYGPEVPTVAVAKPGEYGFLPNGGRSDYWRWNDTCDHDVEYVHGGMPVGIVLLVWLPEDRLKLLRQRHTNSTALSKVFGVPPQNRELPEIEGLAEMLGVAVPTG